MFELFIAAISDWQNCAITCSNHGFIQQCPLIMVEHQGWKRHSLAEIGLSLDVNQSWPLLDLYINEDRGIYQPIANTSGVVFVRYGKNANLDTYISNLGDILTSASVISDRSITYNGKPARNVQVILLTPQQEVYRSDADNNLAHETLPETRTLISVIGFSNRGIPILVGYRLLEEELNKYQAQLEHIVNSVSLP